MSAFRTAAITDEFSPDDLDAALDGMAAVGMTGAELRVVGRRNMIDLSNEEVDAVRAAVEAKGLEVISLASPLGQALKDRKPGEEVSLRLPTMTRKLRVIKVVTVHDQG